MRSVVSQLAAGASLAIALGSIACATAGSRSADAAAEAPERVEAAPVPPSPPVAATPVPPPQPPAVAAAKPAEAPAPAAPAAAAGSESPVAGYLADPAAMTRASQLFRAVCTGYCHSTQQTADRVAPNLFDCDWTHGSSDQEIFDVIAAGVPDTQMQGFGERLPHEDLWKLVAYVRQKSTCK